MTAQNETPSKRKYPPSQKRVMAIYAADHILEECQGAKNRSNRIGAIVRGYALMRRALCPSLPTTAWQAIMGALHSDLPDDLEESEVASLIADRMAIHEAKIAEQLNIDAAALIEDVRGWSPERAWAVADIGWRFWRLNAQLGVRQKLTLLGITPAA